MLRTATLGLALYLAFTASARSTLSVIVVCPIAAPPARSVLVAAPQPQPPPPQPPQPQPPPPQPPQPPPPPPAPPPPAPAAQDPCPAPFTAGTTGELHAPPGIDALTPSRHDVRLLAAWSRDALHVSTDEGQSFQQVLDHRGEIGDVAFDCHGRLHALRGDGELGTYDPRTKAERWTRVTTLWSRGDTIDPGRLVPDGAGVAVIGNTPTRRDRLWLVRRGEDGRWHAKHLFSDREPDYWSGIYIGSIRVLPGDRIRLMATPNMADYGVAECGYSKLFEVTFDPGARRIAVRDLGEGGEHRDDRLQQDPMGRWLLVTDGRAARLTTEELADRLATPPPP
ncbi:MAG TPA: hypothetical protein VNO30_07325 [Kofleriaceae bacterium]|nr:hypothetical protein [Kofleriaceae bacterium]